MRTTLALCAAVTLFAAGSGCLGEFIPNPPAPADDMAHSGTGSGNGTGNGNGTGGNGASEDMATQAAPADGGTTVAGTKLFGDTCTVNGDCQSSLCEQFVMGTVHRCTKSCTAATQATDCPAPSDGTCTPNLYCKFDQ